VNILLLEDEYTLRQSVKEYLEDEGFFVDDYADGEDALGAIFTKSFDILLLDIKVPNMTGLELVAELKKNNIKTPVIFVTSLTNIEQIERCYEAGCCDYIRKPFSLKELYLRIMQAYKATVLKTDEDAISLPHGFTWDITKSALLKDGIETALTKKEALIISLLIENLGNFVGVEAFQSYVWGDDIDPANIRVQINNLRKKLNADIIINSRGFGYKIDKRL
jgi:two-component system, OmpR family, response regulator